METISWSGVGWARAANAAAAGGGRKRPGQCGREVPASEHEQLTATRDSARARLRLGCHPSVVAEARRAVARFELAVPEPVLESARLLVTELVTNSIVHGIGDDDGWVDVLIERRARCLRIEVADPASAGTRPMLRAVGPSSTSGWGLQLVDRLASEWGVETGTGTRVWCEIATG